MAFYTPTVGIITNISTQETGSAQDSGCNLILTLQSEDQGLINIVLPPNVYVLNARQFQTGDRATFFYSPTAPTPMIYPPQYRAVAAAYTPAGTTATLDVFNTRMANSDNTLILNISGNTPIHLPNGQPFYGDLNGKYLLVVYSATTRSIPAQTSPDQVVVFCG